MDEIVHWTNGQLLIKTGVYERGMDCPQTYFCQIQASFGGAYTSNVKKANL